MAKSVPPLETGVSKGGGHEWPVWNTHFEVMFARFAALLTR